MSAVFVGKTKDGFPISVSESQRCEHVQILASTGRGKTKSVILPWLIQDFVRGRSVILIDGKGDQTLVDEIEQFQRPTDEVIVFDLGDIENSATCNPIEHGTAQQIADRIFATFDFDNTYFETVSYEAVLLVLEVFQFRRREISFRELFRALCDDDWLTQIVTGDERTPALPRGLLSLAMKHLGSSRKEREEKLSGLLSQLRPFAIGEISDLVNGPMLGRNYFSLSQLVRYSKPAGEESSSAIVILIPTLLYQKTASRLGQMFLQEIAWALSKRSSSEFLPVFLDEFSSFVYEGFLQVLNKARSSKVAFHLSHQSMGDLEAISPDFAKAVVTNTNIKCVLGINEPETAEFFAKLFGTRRTTKTTERGEKKQLSREIERSGEMSLREVEEYRIHPNTLKAFSQGRGAISFLANGHLITEEIYFEPVPGSL